MATPEMRSDHKDNKSSQPYISQVSKWVHREIRLEYKQKTDNVAKINKIIIVYILFLKITSINFDLNCLNPEVQTYPK